MMMNDGGDWTTVMTNDDENEFDNHNDNDYSSWYILVNIGELDMARYGPFNNPQKIVGSCNLGNLGNFWHEMAKSKIAKIRN